MRHCRKPTTLKLVPSLTADSPPLPQLLLSAKQQLESVVQQKLEEAVSARDHAAVLRFVLLHPPLAIPDKGISRWGMLVCCCAADTLAAGVMYAMGSGLLKVAAILVA
jgi:hypothetical protein